MRGGAKGEADNRTKERNQLLRAFSDIMRGCNNAGVPLHNLMVVKRAIRPQFDLVAHLFADVDAEQPQPETTDDQPRATAQQQAAVSEIIPEPAPAPEPPEPFEVDEW
jgi:hypothetical protein